MIGRITALCGAMVMLGLLAGCVDRDPYRRTDVWYPSGTNAGNLAVMVANPNDLIRGHGEQKSDGKAAVTAVDRIWVDKPKTLPDATGAQGGSGGGAGAGG
jgi:type IV pilus biogenesis protein CpaD/CtpE